MDARLLNPGTGTSASDSQSYTDLNRLAQLKTGDKNSEGNVRKVAQEFESLFLNEMLKSMRSANEVFAKDDFTNSDTTKQYQDMSDQQLSVSLARSGHGIGIADVLTKQMEQMQGVRHTGGNPFKGQAQAQVQATTSQIGPAASQDGVQAQPAALTSAQGMSRQKARSLWSSNGQSATTATRDDRQALNSRRLALPGRATDRLLAGIAPSTSATTTPASASDAQSQGLAMGDWVGAPRYARATTAAQNTDSDSAASLDSTTSRYAQPPLTPGKSIFASADDFVAKMLPMAERAAKRIGVDPRYLVAQAALETGFGKSMIMQRDGSSSHNLFGIKSGSSWDGASARALTTEYEGGKSVKEVASFRAYNSFEQSFQDYVTFLQGNDRYQSALDHAGRPEQFMKELQRAGYATDPQYARKVSQIAKQMQVYQSVAVADSSTRVL
ncbi:MAG: Peptidoglycan hydrolase FlgJ [Stenotrophomonas maltophilia]|nr:MAG: Peptidoglycan hydrolase FlgJ [Stenotrophomonas maltophilia]